MIAILKPFALTGLVFSTLFLDACNGKPFNIQDSVDNSKADTKNSYCQRVDKPIKYSMCQVAQSKLNGGNSRLQLRLFWRAQDVTDRSNKSKIPKDLDSTPKNNTAGDPSEPLYGFTQLIERLNTLPHHHKLLFAVNAGMYNENFAPIGYTVIEGKQVRSLNLKQGGGNFHLLPNGVLWWDKSGNVHIDESQHLNELIQNQQAKPYYATQSGPMLVLDGNIHPKFNADSASLKFRNGVGVCQDGNIKFVNSDEPVNFYNFAALFKDTLQCPKALFLDGGVASALYAPEIEQKDSKNMGVMIGVVKN